jgi:hypothetical protein
MKSLNGVIKTLIWINVFTAISALAIFILIRERQAAIANRPTLPDTSVTVKGNENPVPRLSKTSGENRRGDERPLQLQQNIDRLERELARTKETIEILQSRSRQPVQPVEQPAKARSTNVTSPIVPTIIAISPIPIAERPNPSPVAPRFEPRISPSPEKNEPIEVSESPSAPDKPRVDYRESMEIAMQPAGPLPPRLAPDVAPNRIVLPLTAPLASSPTNPLPSAPSPKTRESLGRTPVARGRSAANGKKVHSIRYANDIAVGLLVADRKGHINYGTKNYRRVQTAILLLRQGEDIETAARMSSVSVPTLHQLIKWGENRPGNLAALAETGEPSSRWQ